MLATMLISEDQDMLEGLLCDPRITLAVPTTHLAYLEPSRCFGVTLPVRYPASEMYECCIAYSIGLGHSK